MNSNDDPLASDPPDPIEPAPLADSIRSVPGPAAGESPRFPKRVLPDDLSVPWDWVDIGLLIAVAIGGTVVVGLLIAMGLKLAGVSPAHIRHSPAAMNVIAILAQMLLDLGLLAYLALEMRLRFHSPFWSTIGWRPITTRSSGVAAGVALALGGFSLAAIVAFAEGLFPPQHPLPIESMTQNPHAAVLFMLTAVFVAPVVEETIFRGYLYPVVARSFGVGMGVVITGTLFGLLHARQLWGGWWQIALLVVVGIVFTIARAATRTVVASYILHASYNALPVVATLLSFAARQRHLLPLH
jgi:uncharacterized protein